MVRICVILLLLLSTPLAAQWDTPKVDERPIYRSLEEALEEPEKVYRLDLSESGIDTLPAEILKLTHLQNLDLSDNPSLALDDALRTLSALPDLRSLYLHGIGQITLLPESIGGLQSLEYLGLGGNSLRTLPAGITRLRKLLHIDLASNGPLLEDKNRSGYVLIDTLVPSGDTLAMVSKMVWRAAPEGLRPFLKIDEVLARLSELPALRSLDLSYIDLESLPESIRKLQALEEINLDGNADLDKAGAMAALARLPRLSRLSINWTTEDLPATAFAGLVHLRSLSFSAEQWKADDAFAAFAGIPNLEDLHITGGWLQRMPESVGHLRNLKTLYVGYNQLTELPKSLFTLPKLERLDISSNTGIAKLPTAIGRLTNLRFLDASGMGLASLPETIGGVASLEHLDLDANDLDAVPESIGKLSKLRWLRLSTNKRLRALPVSFSRLTRLRLLDLSSTTPVDISQTIALLAPMTDLETLAINNCGIRVLPENIGRLTSLRELACSFNPMPALPQSIGALRSLRRLIVTGFIEGKDGLVMLPRSIGSLDSLETLDLHDNGLTALPSTIGGLNRLRSLQLQSNQLDSIPSTIGGLGALREMNIYNNRIGTLPAEIEHLGALRWLSVKRNRLTAVPDGIGGMRRLEHLDLALNQIEALPLSIGKMMRLKDLFLEKNRLTELPATIALFERIERIDISDNRLKALPIATGDWPRIELVKLSGNQFNSEEIERIRKILRPIADLEE